MAAGRKNNGNPFSELSGRLGDDVNIFAYSTDFCYIIQYEFLRLPKTIALDKLFEKLQSIYINTYILLSLDYLLL